MLNFLKSNQYKQIVGGLKKYGYYQSNFKQFNIGEIVNTISSPKHLQTFIQVLISTQHNEVILLKSTIILIHIIQTLPNIQDNQKIEFLLELLQIKLRALNSKHEKFTEQARYLSARPIMTDKKMTSRTIDSSMPTCTNGLSFLLNRVIQPLLSIAQKNYISYRTIYKGMGVMSNQLCWATINLLKKYLQLSKEFEQICRYYQKKYLQGIIYTIVVLNSDIKMLYYRIAKYLKLKTKKIEEIINNEASLTSSEQTQAKELLLLVEEIYNMNELVRLIYLGKYFAEVLKANQIFLPSLYQSTFTVEMLYYSIQKDKNVTNKKTTNNSLCLTSVSSSIINLNCRNPKANTIENVQGVKI